MLRRIFACIDNTTLSATDNEATVEAFCRRTLELKIQNSEFKIQNSELNHVAAVCVYPRFVAVARRVLEGSGIGVASVAGAFPHGQLPLELRVAEVEYAVAQGADEVDIVVSRGALLAGRHEEVRREVEAMKRACGHRCLKAILETGELPSPTLVRTAAELAIEGGADFVKTSTGKIAAGATPEAAEAMLQAVADFRRATGRTIGFKAAGGIRTPDQALQYATLAVRHMGDEYLHPSHFRIGASSLTEALLARL